MRNVMKNHLSVNHCLKSRGVIRTLSNIFDGAFLRKRLMAKGRLLFLPTRSRSSRPEVFLIKGVLKICSKFTGEHLSRRVISIKLQSNFIELTFRHGCSPVNLLHICRTPFSQNISWWLLLKVRHGCLIGS